jgi:hypothetical protein
LNIDLFHHTAHCAAESQYPDERYLLRWILRFGAAGRSVTESAIPQREISFMSFSTLWHIRKADHLLLPVLGMSFYLCYSYQVQSGILVPLDSPDQARGYAFIWSLSLLVILTLGAIASKRLLPLSGQRLGVLLITVVVTGCGTFFMGGHLSIPGFPPLAHNIGIVLAGLGSGYLFLSWSEWFASVGHRQACLSCAASVLLACALFFLVILLPPKVDVLFISLCPLFSLIFMWFGCRTQIIEHHASLVSIRKTGQTKPIVRILLAAAIWGTLVSFSRYTVGLYENSATFAADNTLRIAVTVVVSAAFLLYFFFAKHLKPMSPYHLAVFLALAGGVVLVSGFRFPSRVLLFAADACFWLMTWLLYATVSHHLRIFPTRLLGAAKSFETIGYLLGIVVAGYLSPSFEVGVELNVVTLVSLTMLVLIPFLVFNKSIFDRLTCLPGGRPAPRPPGKNRRTN